MNMRSTLLKMTRRGFTLIELMVVVAIIALLVAVGLPQYTGAQKKARDARIKADLKAIQNAEEVYYSTNNAYVALSSLTWGTAAPVPPTPNTINAGVSAAAYSTICTVTTTTYVCTATLSDGTTFTVQQLQ